MRPSLSMRALPTKVDVAAPASSTSTPSTRASGPSTTHSWTAWRHGFGPRRVNRSSRSSGPTVSVRGPVSITPGGGDSVEAVGGEGGRGLVEAVGVDGVVVGGEHGGLGVAHRRRSWARRWCRSSRSLRWR